MTQQIFTALIVDDEALALRYVRDCLAPHEEIEIVGEANNGIEAISLIEELEPDIVFLDIQMPGKAGTDVLREIVMDNSPAVVFVTAFSEFAVTAFEQQAIDYLLKPFCQERFDIALARVKEVIESRELAKSNEKLRELLKSMTNSEKAETSLATVSFAVDNPTQLRIKTSSGAIFIEPASIDWIESDAYLLAIYANGKRYSATCTMKQMELCLDATQFVRVHRRVIVNVSKISSYRATGTGSFEIALKDGRRLPMSRRRKSLLEALFRKIGK